MTVLVFTGAFFYITVDRDRRPYFTNCFSDGFNITAVNGKHIKVGFLTKRCITIPVVNVNLLQEYLISAQYWIMQILGNTSRRLKNKTRVNKRDYLDNTHVRSYRKIHVDIEIDEDDRKITTIAENTGGNDESGTQILNSLPEHF
jgi:hypothetical protein